MIRQQYTLLIALKTLYISGYKVDISKAKGVLKICLHIGVLVG